MKGGLSLADVQRLPAVVDLVTAGQALGLGRTKTYQLAQTGEFPCRVIRAGRSYLVPTAMLCVPGRSQGSMATATRSTTDTTGNPVAHTMRREPRIMAMGVGVDQTRRCA
jgi:hypothetical protein